MVEMRTDAPRPGDSGHPDFRRTMRPMARWHYTSAFVRNEITR